MTSPISSYARDYVRRTATNIMEYSCRIERVRQGEYDKDSLVHTSGSRAVVYEGICRIWEISATAAIALGDTDLDIQTTQLSTPWDSAIAQKNDEVLITDAPAWDEEMTGKRFQIQSSAKTGELRATRRYTVTSKS